MARKRENGINSGMEKRRRGSCEDQIEEGTAKKRKINELERKGVELLVGISVYHG